MKEKNGSIPPFRVVFKRKLLGTFADAKNTKITNHMKKTTREYLAPEVEVVEMSLVTSVLTGSENLISKPADYSGSGEGFDW